MKVVGLALFAACITALAGGIWSWLLIRNLRVSPGVPWSVAIMAAILWALWRYLAGTSGGRRTAATRRRALRANRIPPRTFVLALSAGFSGVASLAWFWAVLAQLTAIPAHRLPDFSVYPPLTVALALTMAAIVNAVVEEAAFRGYLQSMLEARLGGVCAIAITALVMSPVHAVTQGFVWQIVAFYLLVDILLGTLAFLTNSILPGMVVHAAGLLLFLAVVWPADAARPHGIDGALWINLAQTVIFAMVSALAFIRLAALREGTGTRAFPPTAR